MYWSQISGVTHLVSILGAGLAALVAWLILRSLNRGLNRCWVRAFIPSVVFMAAWPALHAYGSTTTKDENSVCTICGKLERRLSTFGILLAPEGMYGSVCPEAEYSVAFAVLLPEHRHHWSAFSWAIPNTHEWFMNTPGLRHRSDVRAWVRELPQLPEAQRIEVLHSFSKFVPASGAWNPESSFENWQANWFHNHPTPR
ncbi:MAG: hypothetical protein JNL28_09045 [Planctomycetes bacterium]|nr:hypothetical protein [Planctomycetota bacterium]